MDFNKLWAAYPQEYAPCKTSDGTPNFSNQCAIRFGIALIDGDVDVSTFGGVCCWHDHGTRHLLRGEEIADWMKQKKAIFGPVTIYRMVDSSKFLGRRGLMFCRNFWGPGNQGDHIDLWNQTFMGSGNPEYIARSAEVWFWEIDANTIAQMKKQKSISGKQGKKISNKPTARKSSANRGRGSGLDAKFTSDLSTRARTIPYDQIWIGLSAALNPDEPSAVKPDDAVADYVGGGPGAVDGFVDVLNDSPPFAAHGMALVPGDVKFKKEVLKWAKAIKKWYEKHGWTVAE